MSAEPAVLDEIGQLYMKELVNTPLQDLDRLIKQVTATKDAAALYLSTLQSTLHSRLSSLPRTWKRRSTKTRSRKARSMRFSRTQLAAKAG